MTIRVALSVNGNPNILRSDGIRGRTEQTDGADQYALNENFHARMPTFLTFHARNFTVS